MIYNDLRKDYTFFSYLQNTFGEQHRNNTDLVPHTIEVLQPFV